MSSKVRILIAFVFICVTIVAVTFRPQGVAARVYLKNWCDLNTDQIVKITVNGRVIHEQHVRQNLISHQFSHKFKVTQLDIGDKHIKVEIPDLDLIQEEVLPTHSSDYIFVQISLGCDSPGFDPTIVVDTTDENSIPYPPDYEAEEEPLISIYGMSRKEVKSVNIPGL